MRVRAVALVASRGGGGCDSAGFLCGGVVEGQEGCAGCARADRRRLQLGGCRSAGRGSAGTRGAMLHLHNHQLGKVLTGPNGYKRLARLVVRTFYGGECPPREPDEEAPAPSRSRAQKHYFPGLGVLCVDLLAAEDGFVDEEEICRRLRLSQKHVRQALRYLEDQGLLAFQDVKFKKARQKAEPANGGTKGKGEASAAAGAGGKAAAGPKSGAAKLAAAAAAAAAGEDEDEPVRKETKVFWCVDYPRLKDGLRLRLYRVREFIKEQVSDSNPLQDYLCPACGARYTSLDVHRLLDFASGTFRCEDCRGELVQHVEGGRAGAGEEAQSRKELAKRFKNIQSLLEAALRPIADQLEKLKEVDPPDWGSVQDWIAETKEAMKRREKRQRDAAARAAALGAGGEVVPQEWLDDAEVQVNFGGARGAAAAAAAEPGKELPAWFRAGAQASGLASNTTSDATAEPSTAATGAATAAGVDVSAASAAAADDAEAERKRIQEAYLQQYLADFARQRAAAGVGGGGLDDKKDVKRIKTEAGASPAEVKPETVAPKQEHEAGGWQQVQAPAPPQQQQQQQQEQQHQQGEEGDGLGQWEDVEPKGEGVGGGAAGVVDDFDWEDA